MKAIKLHIFFSLIYLKFLNSSFIQTKGDYTDNKNRLLFDSEEPFIYLKDAFKDKLKIGSMVGFTELNNDEDFIKNHFDIITPRYELFPEMIINQKTSLEIGNNTNPQVEFNSFAKKLFEFCEKNKIAIHGHIFVW